VDYCFLRKIAKMFFFLPFPKPDATEGGTPPNKKCFLYTRLESQQLALLSFCVLRDCSRACSGIRRRTVTEFSSLENRLRGRLCWSGKRICSKSEDTAVHVGAFFHRFTGVQYWGMLAFVLLCLTASQLLSAEVNTCSLTRVALLQCKLWLSRSQPQ
jgi:hypothetical protein